MNNMLLINGHQNIVMLRFFIVAVFAVFFTGCAATLDTAKPVSESEAVVQQGLSARSDPEITDKAVALAAFEQACNLGNSYGCHEVGIAYNNGLYGKEKNYQLAKQWYQRAANRDYIPSQLNIANLYAYRLLPLDDRTGYRWLVQAGKGLSTCLPGSIEATSTTTEMERKRLCSLAKFKFRELYSLFRKRMTGDDMEQIRNEVLQNR